ncbi:MAG: hypothetical protein HLUCCA04_03390 [Oceanicaulis sp. HLUCCA04]|nr:MAG: hypothetical protein HLUCCA04_03390 [Oceanicaulis sp. HLUCCA04]
MTKLVLSLMCALTLGACSITGQAARDDSPSSQQAVRLAATLTQAARSGDPVLEHVTAQMTGLEDALARGLPEQGNHEAEAGEASHALAAPPDARSMISLMHSIHLASYREERHLAEGWRALQGQHAALGRLQARYVEADLGERGVYLRLLAGPFDTADDAVQACRTIQASQDWCAVTAFDGMPVLP